MLLLFLSNDDKYSDDEIIKKFCYITYMQTYALCYLLMCLKPVTDAMREMFICSRRFTLEFRILILNGVISKFQIS